MKLVRCRVQKSDDGLFEPDYRYIPVDEFHLWKYMMEAKHGLAVDEPQVMLWVSQEEFTGHRDFYDRFPKVAVTRVSFLNPCEGLETLCPVTRYFATDNAGELTRLLVGHYKGTRVEEPDIVRKAGYCLLHAADENKAASPVE